MPWIIHEPCPGNDEVSGCYFPPGDADYLERVYPVGAVFVSSRYRFTLLHEVGHAFDWTMMDAGEREEFTRIRHELDLLWTWSDTLDNGLTVQGFDTPAEQFADAYANCRMGHTPYGLWEAGYDYYPTPREHFRVCRLIARAGRDAGHPVAVDGSR